MGKKIPIYKAEIQGEEANGIFAMSFVEFPANEKNFVALKRTTPVKLAVNKQKQILTGVVLIPDQLIYRNDDQKGEYYLTFTAPEIERIALKMMRDGWALVTTTHQHGKALEGNYLAELWTVKDPKRDKAVALGLGELPEGTLIASYKIGDSVYWQNEVLAGKVKGFSLEGLFNFNTIHMKKNTRTAAQLTRRQGAAKKKGLSALFSAFSTFFEGEDTETQAEDLVDEATKDDTDSGEPFLIFELSEGGEVWVDDTGFCTLDGGEQMPAGEHALADGNFIVIDDAGNLVETEPEADGAEPSEAAVAMARQRGKAMFKKQPRAVQSRIAKLEKELAELKKQPSTPKAKPKLDGGKTQLSKTEILAQNIRSRRERMGK